jgi:hypothetical protein
MLLKLSRVDQFNWMKKEKGGENRLDKRVCFCEAHFMFE